MVKKGEKIKNCLELFDYTQFLIFYLFCNFYFIVKVEYVYPPSSGGNVYRVKEETTGNDYILKRSYISRPNDSTNDNESDEKQKESEEYNKQKQKYEELISKWKKAQEKTEYIVKYINHWYDSDDKNYSYIEMEYCAKGDLANEITKRIKENKKFSEEVYLFNS
jgi:serine/threonine protein kinase